MLPDSQDIVRLRDVLLAQCLISVARCRQPSQGFRLSFPSGLLVQLAVQVACVHGELQLPRRQQDGRDDEAGHQSSQCQPSPQLEPCARIVVAPKNDATSACAASSVPVRCRIPVTIASWSASA
ncbi:MAG: hypothetical protein QOK24_2834 [Verrucomicrobiota bacterium]